MFFKREKDPTSKQFDDDEWIRSLTVRVGRGRSQASSAFSDGEVSNIVRFAAAFGLSGEIAALTTSMRQIGVRTPRPWPPFISSFTTSGWQGHSADRWPGSKLMRTIALV